MADKAKRAWELAEVNCYKYLKAKLAGIEGVTAHQGEFPLTYTNATDLNVWMFEISGPGPTEIIQTKGSSRPPCSHSMGASLKGVFASRTKAQQTAFLMLDHVPVDTDTAGNKIIKGVTKLWYVQYPTLTRSVKKLKPDWDKGGERRVWLLDFPMAVTFVNIRS